MGGKRTTDPDFLRSDQYHASDNLQARISLHERFSSNPESWFGWEFDRIQLGPQSNLLEIGCGPGDVWGQNLDRLPPGARLILSDLSEGMLAKARQRLGTDRFRFCCLDADRFPYPAGGFDTVIANHMLYHVADISQTLNEVRRTLTPDGKLVAATNGAAHLAELTALIKGFDPNFDPAEGELSFTLENGAEILAAHFKQVERFDFPNDLLVTEVEPLAAYVLSLWSIDQEFFRSHLAEFRTYLQAIMARDGVIKIGKSVGVFVAQGKK